jgi:hypothetical protein
MLVREHLLRGAVVFRLHCSVASTDEGPGLGVGLGLIALPKTIITLSNPVGDIQTKVWYEMSNIGVTNGPSVHKH